MLREGGLWWLVVVGIWLCTITTYSAQELAAAVLCSLPAAAAATWAGSTLGAHWQVSIRPLRPVRFVPRTLLADASQLLLLAAQHRGSASASRRPRSPLVLR